VIWVLVNVVVVLTTTFTDKKLGSFFRLSTFFISILSHLSIGNSSLSLTNVQDQTHSRLKMDDPFYNPATHEAAHLGLWKTILSVPPLLLGTTLVVPLLLIVFTRLLSEKPNNEDIEDEELQAGIKSNWFPRVSHGVTMLVSHECKQIKRED